MEETTSVLKILKSNNFEALKESFKTAKAFSGFKDQSDNNLLHLIARYSEPSFLKKVFNFYHKESPEIINNLLLARNSEGAIPANKEFMSNQDKALLMNALNPSYKVSIQPMSEEDLRKNRNYIFLKRETKRIASQGSDDFFSAGEKFKNDTPNYDIKIKDSKFFFELPVYPTIKLIRYEYDEQKKKGLSSDKNDASYINYVERVDYEKNNETFKGKNLGEYITLAPITMSSNSLGKDVYNNLDFPEDYTQNIKALNVVGDTIKDGFKDEVYQSLFRKFVNEQGVIIVEDQNRKYFSANTTTNSNYYGFFEDVQDKRTDDYFPTITLDGSEYSRPEIRNTLNHELTHATGSGFSSLGLMKYYLALKALDKNLAPELKNALKINASDYESRSFKEESLAEFNALKTNSNQDETTKELFKVFDAYVIANSKGNEKLIEFIDEASESFKNINPLKELFQKLSDAVVKNKTYEYESGLSSEKLALLNADFLNDLRRINKDIDTLTDGKEKRNRARFDGLLKFMPSYQEIKDTFEQTSALNREELLNSLDKSIHEYVSDRTSKAKLFKLALITSKAKSTFFPEDKGSRFNQSFTSTSDYSKIRASDYDDKNLLSFAHKLSKTLKLQGQFSDEALHVSLNSSLKASEVALVIDNACEKMKKMSKTEALTTFKDEFKKRSSALSCDKISKNDILSLVGLIKIAEIACEKNGLNPQISLKDTDAYKIGNKEILNSKELIDGFNILNETKISETYEKATYKSGSNNVNKPSLALLPMKAQNSH